MAEKALKEVPKPTKKDLAEKLIEQSVPVKIVQFYSAVGFPGVAADSVTYSREKQPAMNFYYHLQTQTLIFTGKGRYFILSAAGCKGAEIDLE